jgi:hypothetical protein
MSVKAGASQEGGIQDKDQGESQEKGEEQSEVSENSFIVHHLDGLDGRNLIDCLSKLGGDKGF